MFGSDEEPSAQGDQFSGVSVQQLMSLYYGEAATQVLARPEKRWLCLLAAIQRGFPRISPEE